MTRARRARAAARRSSACRGARGAARGAGPAERDRRPRARRGRRRARARPRAAQPHRRRRARRRGAALRGDATAATTLARLREAPVQLGYPLIEGELLRRRRAAVVDRRGRRAARAARPTGTIMRWRDYVVAPVAAGGPRRRLPPRRPAPAARRVRALERDGAVALRRGLRAASTSARSCAGACAIQRQELRQVASWADARTRRALATARSTSRATASGRRRATAPRARRDAGAARPAHARASSTCSSTWSRARPTPSIARALVVSEGTVKFHVKNILRKMHVANRAEATSRYLRLSYRRGGSPS